MPSTRPPGANGTTMRTGLLGYACAAPRAPAAAPTAANAPPSLLRVIAIVPPGFPSSRRSVLELHVGGLRHLGEQRLLAADLLAEILGLLVARDRAERDQPRRHLRV